MLEACMKIVVEDEMGAMGLAVQVDPGAVGVPVACDRAKRAGEMGAAAGDWVKLSVGGSGR